MDIFFFTLSKLVPLYIIAMAGYAAAKALKLDFETLTKLFFYVFLPVVVFYGTYHTPLTSGGMTLPVIFFLVASFISVLFLVIGKLMHKEKTAYLLGMTAGSNNVGNLGIPLSIAVFGVQAVSPAVMAVLGFTLWWSTVGFFIASKGNFSTAQTIKKIVTLPPLYAFLFGVIFQLLKLPIPYQPIIEQFVSGYSVLGFLIVGAGMAQITREAVDKFYVTMSLVAKFVVWPLVTGAIILFDSRVTHLFTPLTRNVFFLLSLCPLALNSINVASIVKLHPEKAAVAVTTSTILAIIYIPVMISLFVH